MVHAMSTTFGWKKIEWDGPKHRCQACNREVSEGTVNIANAEPTSDQFKVLCNGCAEILMTMEAPKSWGTPEWKGEA